MAQTLERSAAPAQPTGLLRRDEIAMAFFGTWAMIGLYLDGWAHTTNLPETFFSPWHLVLYSGVGAAVTWFSFDGWRRRRRGEPTPDDRIGAVGLAIFGAGAVGDFVWHEIFGIEEGIEALLSPTHLALMIGGALMLSAGLRSMWAKPDDGRPSLRAFWPAVASVTLVTAVVSFFFMYLSAFFLFEGLRPLVHGWPGELEAIRGVAAILVTNAIFLGPTLLLLKRWRTPFGTFTLMYGALALLMVGMREFQFPLLVVAAVVGGLAADLLVQRLRPSSRLLGAGIPLVLWPAWFVAVHLGDGVAWPPELIAGSVVLASCTGWVLSVLVWPPSAPAGRGRGPASDPPGLELR